VAVRDFYLGAKSQHLVVILGVALEELLPEGVADLGIGLHENPALSAISAGAPCALPAGDVAVLVEFCRVFTEVLDVSVYVLRVVVRRPLAQDAVYKDLVFDDTVSSLRVSLKQLRNQ
jgi:hypothetical protein